MGSDGKRLKGKVPRHKVVRVPEFREVVYDAERWELLRRLRATAAELMGALTRCGYGPIAHGSVARGDVTRDSDVDVVVPYLVAPALVEACLERGGYRVSRKLVVRATPKSALRAVYELDPEGRVTVSFPLEELSPRELEFYRFGGQVSYEELLGGLRVPGVSKSLVLIVPTERGHREAPVVGYEHYVARLLGVSIETVMERVEVLTRRDEVGRTGLFLRVALGPSESVEEVVERLLRESREKR